MDPWLFPFQEELKKQTYEINIPFFNVCAEKWIESMKFQTFDPITALNNLRKNCKGPFREQRLKYSVHTSFADRCFILPVEHHERN